MSGKIFGNILAYVYTFEFQKRGHAHMLFVLDYKNKLTTLEMIDKYISAEIPSIDFELQQLVIKHMDHIPIILYVTINRKMNVQKSFQNNFVIPQNLKKMVFLNIDVEIIKISDTFIIKNLMEIL